MNERTGEDDKRIQKQRRIVEAALQVFVRKGFTETRVEDICTEAGIAKGTYYLYFNSREEVLSAIFTTFLAEKASAFDSLLQADDPVTGLVDALSALLDEAAAQIDFVPLFWEIAGHRIVQSKFELNRRIGELFSSLAAPIRALLEAGRAAGKIRPDIDIPAFSRMIISAVDGVVLHSAIFRDSAPEFLMQQKAELGRMVRHYLEKGSTQ